MDKFLTQDSVKSIINNAPKGSNPDAIVNGLVSRGYVLEGLNDQEYQQKKSRPVEPTLGDKLAGRAKL